MLSHICEAFSCTPDVARAMKWADARDIGEYRNLRAARDQHNQDASKMTPGQMRLWREMNEALDG